MIYNSPILPMIDCTSLCCTPRYLPMPHFTFFPYFTVSFLILFYFLSIVSFALPHLIQLGNPTNLAFLLFTVPYRASIYPPVEFYDSECFTLLYLPLSNLFFTLLHFSKIYFVSPTYPLLDINLLCFI